MTSIDSIRSQDGILYNSDLAQEGYVLSTHDFNTYLIDQCGQIVNTWSAWNIDLHAKLTDEGNIYYIKEGRIIERDWEDNVVVEIEYNVPELKLVYDIVKMKNGNYLVNCRWAISSAELIQLGWDTNLGGTNLIDGVVEINPQGEIVWAWNIADHTVQDIVTGASNFGSIKNNPQLLDIRAISDFDWQFNEAFMFNGIDYNEELDLILVSVRKMSEFIIIDHSTTTEEAIGNIGGDYGKGGDILYRWGNPQNYNPSSNASRHLYYQHNPNWIEFGAHKGGIIVFNNGLSTDLGSSVIIVTPDIDSLGNFIMVDSTFSPNIPDREIGYEIFDYRSSEYTSGAKVMENGNIYITSGEWDQFIEITPSDEIAWNYKLEDIHYTYRTEKYPKTHPGLVDKDLTPGGTIESPPSDYECMDFSVSTADLIDESFEISIIQNENTLEINSQLEDLSAIRIFDRMGRRISSTIAKGKNQEINISTIRNQLIVLQIENNTHQTINKIIYLK